MRGTFPVAPSSRASLRLVYQIFQTVAARIRPDQVGTSDHMNAWTQAFDELAPKTSGELDFASEVAEIQKVMESAKAACAGVTASEERLTRLATEDSLAAAPLIQCVVGGLFSIPPAEPATAQFISAKLRSFFELSHKRFTMKSANAFILDAEFSSDHKHYTQQAFVIKTPQRHGFSSIVSFVHEACVGLCAVNSLRSIIPNFVYTYGLSLCSAADVAGKGKDKSVDLWCMRDWRPDSPPPQSAFMLEENLSSMTADHPHAGTTLATFVSKDTPLVTALGYLAQTILALGVAWDRIGFVHNDLHTNNVMLRYQNGDASWISFPLSESVRTPILDHLMPVLFDFGASRAIINGRAYGVNAPRIGQDADAVSPARDVVTLVSFFLFGLKFRIGASSALNPITDAIYRRVATHTLGRILYGHLNDRERLHRSLEWVDSQRNNLYVTPILPKEFAFDHVAIAKHILQLASIGQDGPGRTICPVELVSEMMGLMKERDPVREMASATILIEQASVAASAQRFDAVWKIVQSFNLFRASHLLMHHTKQWDAYIRGASRGDDSPVLVRRIIAYVYDASREMMMLRIAKQLAEASGSIPIASMTAYNEAMEDTSGFIKRYRDVFRRIAESSSTTDLVAEARRLSSGFMLSPSEQRIVSNLIELVQTLRARHQLRSLAVPKTNR